MIVGAGAEKESVLRVDCLPSGEKLLQHPLKWPVLEKNLVPCCAIRAGKIIWSCLRKKIKNKIKAASQCQLGNWWSIKFL